MVRRRVALVPPLALADAAEQEIRGGKGIEATVTVEDPGTFNQPWSGTARWQKVDRGTMLESICAENNGAFEKYFGLQEYPQPEAKTADF